MSRRLSLNSGDYNDPQSFYNATLSEEQRIAIRDRQRERARVIREREPKVPDRPWPRADLKYVLLSNQSLLTTAIYLNRNYQDVSTASAQLTHLFNEQPEVLAAFLEMTMNELALKRKVVESQLKVCTECFTTPHQFTCSQAE